ncbi:hydroxyisourate hydrolase [Streptomyces sp. NBC_01754]|uniref:hydroxyisourate hydrolase n=1 Tax=Streptomyces sp. NBC_01754 TaxID=2975930 RepID=UPI002DD8537B|nr:hydroxyisourate hydrolase [Streptomyces sp. NBC_01754]WSC95780.1 hydroxyisourate hydrolase [Streptomyces sp. NBC_01754]
MSTDTTASVSTHVLDTSIGRPAEAVTVSLAARSGGDERYVTLGAAPTDKDGRCQALPALPEGTTHVRLVFDTESYFTVKKQAEAQQDAPRVRDSGAFFPEVAIAFAVIPGEHYHVPLLLNPFGYSVYRGS